MTAEQKITSLRELKRRIEELLSYYRGYGERELAFVQFLEGRLSQVCGDLELWRARGGFGDLALRLAA